MRALDADSRQRLGVHAAIRLRRLIGGAEHATHLLGTRLRGFFTAAFVQRPAQRRRGPQSLDALEILRLENAVVLDLTYVLLRIRVGIGVGVARLRLAFFTSSLLGAAAQLGQRQHAVLAHLRFRRAALLRRRHRLFRQRAFLVHAQRGRQALTFLPGHGVDHAPVGIRLQTRRVVVRVIFRIGSRRVFRIGRHRVFRLGRAFLLIFV